MANEIQLPLGLAAQNVYALVRNTVGQIYAGTTAGAYSTAAYATYPITLVEQGTASGFYVGTFPVLAAGTYHIEVRLRAGVSPAETDLTIANGSVNWSGTAVIVAAAVGSEMNLADSAISESKISTPAEAAGIPTGILAMIRRLFERSSNKQTRNRTTGVYTLRNAADSASLETATQSTSGATDTISGKS